MRRALALCTAALVAGCGDTSVAPFGQLASPVALALHGPSGQLFVGSLAGDELRVLDARSGNFLTAPAALFPLSIPTVRNPTRVAAAERFVFVLSGATSELGFVDTVLAPGAAGPRSVDTEGGFPLTLPLDFVPSSMAAFGAAYPWAEPSGVADHVLVAGVEGEGEGGLLFAARPPVLEEQELPAFEALVALPGAAPAWVAIEDTGLPAAGLVGPGGALVDDCRTVAVADARQAEGHTPGVWLTSARVAGDGTLALEPFGEGSLIPVEVPVRLPDGTVEVRAAPVREVAFAPVPVSDAQLSAVAADPCAIRAGRLIALLDPRLCSDAESCPDVAVIDLAGPTAADARLAVDAETGGPALYDVPATALHVTTLSGPLDLPGAFHPSALDEANLGRPLDEVSSLALVASTNGALYYVNLGLGAWLAGPGPDDRAPADEVFLIDAQEEGPGLSSAVDRAGAIAGDGELPVVAVPPGARPRDEAWTAGFLAPLPGYGDVGRVGSIADGALAIPDAPGRPAVVPSDDERAADRVVPRPLDEALRCDGFPVVGVSADGLTLELDTEPESLVNDEGCLLPAVRLAVLPPLDAPWWLAGELTGFVARLPAAAEPIEIGAADRLLFELTPAEAAEPGATYAWATTDGFASYRASSDLVTDLPAAMASFPRRRPAAGANPVWSVFVAYSGQDALLEFDPTAPFDPELFQ